MIMFPIKSLEDLQRISREAKWQYFERLVGWIFEKNDFDVDVSRVFVYPKGKRQFDVISERFGKTFLVECKKWKRSNSSALRKSAEKHAEKCMLYGKDMEGETIPLLVTLLEEGITSHMDVPIVPVDKLNAFINNINEFY